MAVEMADAPLKPLVGLAPLMALPLVPLPLVEDNRLPFALRLLLQLLCLPLLLALPFVLLMIRLAVVGDVQLVPVIMLVVVLLLMMLMLLLQPLIRPADDDDDDDEWSRERFGTRP